MAEPYTCESCRHCIRRSTIRREIPTCELEHRDDTGHWRQLSLDDSCGCWLPPRHAWKSGTCGTCDYRADPEASCGRCGKVVGPGPRRVDSQRGACSSWMPTMEDPDFEVVE